MRTEKEIIDMENFYATATLEEAFEYFKNIRAAAMDKLKAACKKAISICKGMLSRFASLRQDIAIAQALMDSDINTDGFTSQAMDDLEDRYEMELLLIEAKQILLIRK